jgi:hypothetical protein
MIITFSNSPNPALRPSFSAQAHRQQKQHQPGAATQPCGHQQPAGRALRSFALCIAKLAGLRSFMARRESVAVRSADFQFGDDLVQTSGLMPS